MTPGYYTTLVVESESEIYDIMKNCRTTCYFFIMLANLPPNVKKELEDSFLFSSSKSLLRNSHPHLSDLECDSIILTNHIIVKGTDQVHPLSVKRYLNSMLNMAHAYNDKDPNIVEMVGKTKNSPKHFYLWIPIRLTYPSTRSSNYSTSAEFSVATKLWNDLCEKSTKFAPIRCRYIRCT
ncbi:hypothetical protein TRFO_42184 [Tritrichomonas foetus]|uniref:Uncharacterized protein n=1 Tax=Tritrichomonas foetus TaxID=1144522 RepID=A0A1J4KXD6_9EUKA|nr:hypothetical protein TRFO_42184 [Tritrichomonas foetus]|eukprot:OHT15915.1 hypothetical protein TRFO_42184 [Tritrichomonas foetus]